MEMGRKKKEEKRSSKGMQELSWQLGCRVKKEDALGVFAELGQVKGGVLVGFGGFQLQKLDWRLACMHMGNELSWMAISILGCFCHRYRAPNGRDCLESRLVRVSTKLGGP